MDRKMNSFANKWTRRVAVALVLLTLPAFSFAFTSPQVKKGEFQGGLKLRFFVKTSSGWFDDLLDIANVRFSATQNDISSGKEIAGDLAFEGRTASGKRVSVRMQRPGKGVTNLTDGKVGFSLPLRITVEGKTADVTLNMTSEPVVAPDGATIRGRRLEVDQATGTVKFVVGGIGNANGLIAIFAPVPSAASGTTADLIHISELKVVMRLDGKLSAVEQ